MAQVSVRNLRRHQRVKPSAKAPIEVHIMGAGFLDVVRARDISAGGLGVFIPHDFEGSDIRGTVELIVILPAEKAFKVKATIQHVSRDDQEHYFGVQFVALPPLHLGSIERYVARRVAEGGGT